MRSIIRRCLIAGAFCTAMFVSAAAGGDVTLELDGAQVVCDAPPVIVEGRALVPVRALFEAMDGAVDPNVKWDPVLRRVDLSYVGTSVTLVIGQKVALVNGQEKSMEVPAEIRPGDRTFIPVRFVAEALGFFVDWDPDRRTVLVNSPEESELEFTSVESIEFVAEDGMFRASVGYTGAQPDCRTAAYEEPDRFVVDVSNARIRMDAYEGGSMEIPGANAAFERIRYSQFDTDIVRIVFDLNTRQTGKISMPEGEGVLTIDFTDPNALSEETGEPASEEGDETEPEETDLLIPALDWRMADQLVAIDAGHGGKDPGCLVIDGNRTLHEKDFNLEIALALDNYLTRAGVKTFLLRTTDETLGLQERPVLANEAGADLFVSIHNNSANTPVPNGSQVFYYAKESEADYVVGSKTLAQNILDRLLRHIGLADRGITSQGAYAVLNKTCMPAVIVEGGFFSNPEDRVAMLDPAYTDRYARGVAQAVIDTLNRAAENERE